MGTSTDAILTFGFLLNEEGEEGETPGFLEKHDGDFDEFLNELSGLPVYGEPGHSFEAQRAFRNACPADLVMHCSYDYPMYILSVRGTECRAKRGYATEINNLYVEDDDIAAFKAWCEANDIEYQEPKWLLVSMWG